MDKNTTTLEAETTFSDLINILSSISVDKYNKVPFEGSWTSGQLAQHVILSAAGFVEVLNGPSKDTTRNPEHHISQLRALFLDFGNRMQSPDFILPEKKEYGKQDQIHTLGEIKINFLKSIQTADLTKLRTAFKLPNLGYLTGAEAVTFTIVHTQRDLQQLRNITGRLT